MQPIRKLLLLATIVISALASSACSITQQHEQSVSSAVGNLPDGGYVGMLWTGGKFGGYLFVAGVLPHYNGLIDLYGGAPQTINNESIGFVPALKENAGVATMPAGQTLQVMHLKKVVSMKSDGLVLIDREHADDYKLMRWWEDNGVPRQTFLNGLLK
jgi:hypothetical protein